MLRKHAATMTSNKKSTELPWLTDSACSSTAETAETQNLSVLGGPRPRSYWFYSLVCGLLADIFNHNPDVFIFFMKQEENLVFVSNEVFLKRIKKGQFGKKRKKLKLASIIIYSTHTHTQKLFCQAWQYMAVTWYAEAGEKQVQGQPRLNSEV